MLPLRSTDFGALLGMLPLTTREREVLHWVAGGKRDRDIADILGISPRTVHKHLQRIYEKLGVETRTAAVMRAARPALLRGAAPIDASRERAAPQNVGGGTSTLVASG